MNIEKSPVRNNKSWSQYLLLALLAVGLTILMLPGCSHDPIIPIDPGPIDTTGNPIDTTPVDTTDGTTGGTPCDPNVVYFTKDVLPILVSNCAMSGCHNAQSHKEGVIMDNFHNVFNTGQVKPFDLNKSKLYKSITTTSGENRMPPSPAQRLTADQIAIVSKWILQGAKDLTCDENAGSCDTTAVSYSTFISPIISTYCLGCHSGGSPSGNLKLTSYSDVHAIALNGKLVGSMSWANGYKAMPQGTAKLSDCKINKFKAWINHGAPNN